MFPPSEEYKHHSRIRKIKEYLSQKLAEPLANPHSLRNLLLSVVILAMSPVLILTVVENMQKRQEAIITAKEKGLSILRLTMQATVQNKTDETRQLLATLAHSSEIQNSPSSQCDALFSNILKENPVYSNIGVITPRGEINCSAQKTTSPVIVTDRMYFQEAIHTKTFTAGEFQIGRITGLPSIVFAYPIVDKRHEITRVLFAALDLSKLSALIGKEDLPQGSSFTLFDSKGIVLTRYPHHEDWVGREEANTSLMQKLYNAQEGEVIQAMGMDGIDRFYAFLTLQKAQTKAFAVIGFPVEEILGEVNNQFLRHLLALGLTIIMALILAWSGTKVILLERMQNLVTTMAKFGVGDMSARVEVDNWQDEFSTLGKQMNKLLTQTERRIKRKKNLIKTPPAHYTHSQSP